MYKLSGSAYFNTIYTLRFDCNIKIKWDWVRSKLHNIYMYINLDINACLFIHTYTYILVTNGIQIYRKLNILLLRLQYLYLSSHMR